VHRAHLRKYASDSDDELPLTSQVTSMAHIVENFNQLFETATSLPAYSEKMEHAAQAVYMPMFKEFTAEFMKEFNTNIVTKLKKELTKEMNTTIHEEFEQMRTDFNKQTLEFQTVKQDLAEIREDIRQIHDSKQEMREDIVAVKNDLTKTRTEVADNNKFREHTANDFKYLYESVQQHQLFLETLDYDKRKCNVILTGVPENQNLKEGEDIAATDHEKVSLILKSIGQAENLVESLSRLGKAPSGPENRTRDRPIKVTLLRATDRYEILSASKNLKNFKESNISLSKIYIKKDTHPGIRREIKRLQDVVAAERRKPENRGRNVRYEWRERVVKIDEHIIDTYQPTFF